MTTTADDENNSFINLIPVEWKEDPEGVVVSVQEEDEGGYTSKVYDFLGVEGNNIVISRMGLLDTIDLSNPSVVHLEIDGEERMVSIDVLY